MAFRVLTAAFSANFRLETGFLANSAVNRAGISREILLPGRRGNMRPTNWLLKTNIGID
ncbi:hypothetical protein RBSWK_04146 [Rhodopirellula baltica SWK14]|uniref:Uncharacterized protein n=1 Tax=Rhodopirellula baltica SWK14 TaxID=993516 RepID=L7CG15_RHOBT|nr:hypothetical protein RBSWK_04146 [Rhodopirellula baltica SWK14]